MNRPTHKERMEMELGIRAEKEQKAITACINAQDKTAKTDEIIELSANASAAHKKILAAGVSGKYTKETAITTQGKDCYSKEEGDRDAKLARKDILDEFNWQKTNPNISFGNYSERNGKATTQIRALTEAGHEITYNYNGDENKLRAKYTELQTEGAIGKSISYSQFKEVIDHNNDIAAKITQTQKQQEDSILPSAFQGDMKIAAQNLRNKLISFRPDEEKVEAIKSTLKS